MPFGNNLFGYAAISLLIFFLSYSKYDNEENKPIIVYTKLGRILGSIIYGDDGNKIYSFRGIPYAQPPMGQQRFRFPLPKLPWTETWDATKDGEVCLQYSAQENKVIGDENCLFLNVYTPKLQNANFTIKFPVMVYIHGGAFMVGSGSSYECGPHRLVGRDILLVAMNYRLGAFGFLSMEDEIIPGNIGLKDQIQALQWIQENIQYFGGDPTRVTIFGESAGSFSAFSHITSPLGEGLFHGVIAQSGALTCDWTMTQNPKQYAILLGNLLNCSVNNSTVLVECLRNASPRDIAVKIEEINNISDNREKQKFRPTLETPITNETHIPELPWIRIQRGDFIKVPILIGVNKDEGFRFHQLLKSIMKNYNMTTTKMFLPVFLMRFFPELNEDEQRTTYNNILKEYFSGNETTEEDLRNNAYKVIGDVSYIRTADKAIRMLTEKEVPTYAYKLTYFNETNKKGIANHMDDLQYLFRTNLYPNNYDLRGDDRIISNYMVTLWTNFAKTKVPSLTNGNSQTIEIVPSTTGQPKYLNINKNLSMMDGYLSDKGEFWNRQQFQTNS